MKKGTVKLPNGKVLSVIPATKIKVGAYRRMKRFDSLLEESQDNPGKETELLDTCYETLEYLLINVSESDLDDCTPEELGELLQKSVTIMSEGAGMDTKEDSGEESKSPKARTRKRKTSK